MSTMICAARPQDSAFSIGNMGPSSVTLSQSGGFEYPVEMDAPKRRGSLMNSLFTRRNSTSSIKQDKTLKPANYRSVFSRRGSTQPLSQSQPIPKPSQEDEATAALIAELQSEGRSEEEIAVHLSFIHDMPAQPKPEPTKRSSPKRSGGLTRFFREMKQKLEDEFALGELVIYEPQPECHPGLTVAISAAPFYGALPPEMDMSYEEFAAMEPVYVGSKCINNLPSCTHDGTPLPGEQTKCSICLGDFEEGECLKSLPCVHFYHKDCIDSWLLVGHACPVCKFLVQ